MAEAETKTAGDEYGATVYHVKQSDQGVSITVRNFSLWYALNRALWDNNLDIQKGLCTALIGPSGCGKSTLLRSMNRMNDLIDDVRVQGQMLIEEEPIYGASIDVIALRKRMGMVFQKPNPFPMSILENVVYPLRIDGVSNKAFLREAAEAALRGAALWEEVKNRLNESALSLSGGQQQRLCIARAIAGNPEVLLMDEPCSALDPIATAKIEELIDELKGRYTIIIVTHNMQQAARVSDNTAFMYLGRLIEYGDTKSMFEMPKAKRTEDYLTGRFG